MTTMADIRQPKPDPILNLTAYSFRNWAAIAQPGEVLVYHKGHLGEAREPHREFAVKSPQAKRLDAVAEAAWACYQAGKVELVQARIGKGNFAYLAVKRHGDAEVV